MLNIISLQKVTILLNVVCVFVCQKCRMDGRKDSVLMARYTI